MATEYSVLLKTVLSEYEDILPIFLSSDYEEKLIFTADLNRPGMQLTGFFDSFESERIQILGKAEVHYLESLTPEIRRLRLEELFRRRCPCLIFAHGQEVPEECVLLARNYNISLFRTDVDTSEIYAQLIGTLRHHLAPRETLHGVLVEVHGEGMLIMGDSGVGKSETALELIKRGHRLIADDAVEILRTSRRSLIGRAPELIRNYMELRGVGVVDIQQLYGVAAVKPATPIDLVVALELWDDKRLYDRLGIENEHMEILGVSVPMVRIPVRPGRNLAVILELTAINNRQKKTGVDAAAELVRRVDSHVDRLAAQAEG